MPVTKTAKRALRSSKRKALVNTKLRASFEIALRKAEKSRKGVDIKKAVSLSDKAKKKGLIHKNKAARLKSRLTKITKAPKK